MDYAGEPIAWQRTADGEFPYRASHDGVDLRLRVNDFPAEPLYTLFVDYRPAFDLDDWPAPWLGPAPTADQLRAGSEARRSRGVVDAIVVADWAHRLCTAPPGPAGAVLEALGAGREVAATEQGGVVTSVRVPCRPPRADLEALLGPGLTAAPAAAPFVCEVVLGDGGLVLVRRAAEGRPTTPSSART
ncbi:hypothetical protein [Actinoplanes sp. NPDC051411]|uniref:hypothetical protein n=1 Tax=Actinoplanes sp. NPDC051411 TaxID=3155522 RepID=UPI0034320522